jgi:hypothetical protein
MSGEESGRGICLSGEREDLSGSSPAVRAATLPLEILSSEPENSSTYAHLTHQGPENTGADPKILTYMTISTDLKYLYRNIHRVIGQKM